MAAVIGCDAWRSIVEGSRVPSCVSIHGSLYKITCFGTALYSIPCCCSPKDLLPEFYPSGFIVAVVSLGLRARRGVPSLLRVLLV